MFNKQILSSSLVFIFIVLLVSCQSNTKQETNTKNDTSMSNKNTFDEAAAKKYGADAYGMKKYVFAFLKKGPNRDLDKEKANALQMEHLKNISRMAKEGKLVVAGPFLGDGDLRGIYIFNVATIEEAEALTNTDPAIKAGSLVMELKEWYGSAALVAVNDIHKTISKQSIGE